MLLSGNPMPAGAADISNMSAVMLPLNKPARASLSASGEKDLFAFQAVAKTRYMLKTKLDTLEDSLLRLLGTDGATELASDDDGGGDLASRIVWTAPKSGKYFLEVSSADDGAGAYRLTAALAPAKRGGIKNITIGSSAKGTVDQTDESECFRFQAVAGARYSFKTQLGTLRDSILKITDPNGNQLAYDDDSAGGLASQIDWTAPSTGTFYVEVAGHNSNQRGTFTLISSLATEDETDNTSDSDSDNVYIPNRQDRWRFLNSTRPIHRDLLA